MVQRHVRWYRDMLHGVTGHTVIWKQLIVIWIIIILVKSYWNQQCTKAERAWICASGHWVHENLLSSDFWTSRDPLPDSSINTKGKQSLNYNTLQNNTFWRWYGSTFTLSLIFQFLNIYKSAQISTYEYFSLGKYSERYTDVHDRAWIVCVVYQSETFAVLNDNGLS